MMIHIGKEIPPIKELLKGIDVQILEWNIDEDGLLTIKVYPESRAGEVYERLKPYLSGGY
jgi:hypothetical protein